ncbi:hypothetical protein XA68_12228 [Ophiocordyceps unilateralis]|uniref:DnaJ homolog 1, mitochondrial n=1 Tax=Ophiocordyceps unilateralis TaxID=268505 RepID=A0A2A9PDE1_OPHUN|nr:hypothetical protein XA68_12228 [Ophiocordyceps unilateralis]
MNSSMFTKAVAPMRMLAQSQIVVRDYGCKRARYHTAAFSRPRSTAKRRLDTWFARRSFHATTRLGEKNPYKNLGVNKNATAAEIKKAYYGLAKKYHPDTNKDPTAKDRFAEIQSAYEILSDPQKRQQYDQFGDAAFAQNGGGASGGHPFDGGFAGFTGKEGFPFEDLFAAFTGQAGRRRQRGGFESPFSSPFEAAEVLVGENIEVFTSVTFTEAAKGTTKTITITPMTPCKSCSGSGLRPGAKRASCKNCNGTGTRLHFMHGGMQMASTCNTCEGTGSAIPRGSECSTCSGNGVVRERMSMPVEVPAGIEDGMRLKFEGAGDAPPMGRAANPKAPSDRGDLYVSVRVAKDPKFTRDGANLTHVATIPFTTALLGGQVSVPTLDGSVNVKVATGTNTGDKQVLAGMGIKRLNSRRNSGFGDLKVEFRVNMPKSLNGTQRTLLEMLADSLGDKSARRVMNVSASSSPDDAESHKNEGFLKSIWHTLTNHPAHENTAQDNQADKKTNSSSSSKAKDESSKKSSDSSSG